MEVVEKLIKKEKNEVIKEAKAFFEGRLGLSLRDEVENCCLEFTTDLGFVNVQVSERNGKTAVTLRSREYERQAKRFIRNL
ncbi:MAG: hypothetical protein KGY80_14295 [Candidatus Thorarchaeota archaeon]|nr:hypothetical protein [Candidatus Thorarchaeota archaeon]